jgi:hypothetical protein
MSRTRNDADANEVPGGARMLPDALFWRQPAGLLLLPPTIQQDCKNRGGLRILFDTCASRCGAGLTRRRQITRHCAQRGR